MARYSGQSHEKMHKGGYDIELVNVYPGVKLCFVSKDMLERIGEEENVVG